MHSCTFARMPDKDRKRSLARPEVLGEFVSQVFTHRRLSLRKYIINKKNDQKLHVDYIREEEEEEYDVSRPQ